MALCRARPRLLDTTTGLQDMVEDLDFPAQSVPTKFLYGFGAGGLASKAWAIFVYMTKDPLVQY
jgi:hypothetical protein